jgi:cell division septation protein DedD
LPLPFFAVAFGPRRILQAFETSQPLPMQRPASMHGRYSSSSAWWRCLASDPGPGHWPLAPTFLAAGSESKQPSPASHQEKSKSAEADFNAPKHRDIAHRSSPSPSPLQRRGWQDGGGPGDIVCRSVNNSCRRY